MNKTIDDIASMLQTAKHPFHQTEDRPTKARQHRYERRKMNEHLRISEWLGLLREQGHLPHYAVLHSER